MAGLGSEEMTDVGAWEGVDGTVEVRTRGEGVEEDMADVVGRRRASLGARSGLTWKTSSRAGSSTTGGGDDSGALGG